MGYYTRYDISDNPQTVQQAIEEKSQYHFYSGQTDTVKWYDWQEHCKEVSKNFPNLVIKVEGDGEEQGDQWKAYIKNGKIQIAKAVVTFEEFDEAKLN
jgi:uncharacterized protein YtpQ (UPF0354 family)